MKKKMRKFADGGYSTVDPENPVPSIDDDVRSRAMKFVENASEESRDIGAPVTRSAAKSTSKVSQTVAPPAKPTVDMEAEKTRIGNINKKQGLIGVYPEEMLVGGGAKALQVAGTKLASKIATDRAAKQASEAAAKNVTRRSEEGFNPSEAMEALKPIRTRTIKGKDIPVRQGNPRFGGSTNNVGVNTVKNKSGKKIPVKKQTEDAGDGGSGAFKRGGTVSKADMQKAGFYDKDKTKSERQNIVKKVTTKPQRVAIVEKAFSSKNMKSGGMASRRADGCAIRGKTRA